MLDENSLDSHYGLANVYYIQGRNKEAIEECIFVLSRIQNNYDLGVMLLLSKLYVADGEYDKAISISESILEGRIDKKSIAAEVYYRLGIAYKEKGEKNLSDVNFQKSVDIYKALLEGKCQKY